MPLEEYRRKRDFEVTAEPKGAGRNGAPAWSAASSCSATARRGCTTTSAWRSAASWSAGRCRAGRRMRPLDRAASSADGRPSHRVPRLRGHHPGGEYGAGDVIVWDLGHVGAGGPGRAGCRRGGWRAQVRPARAAPERALRARTYQSRAPAKEDWLLITKPGETTDAFWDVRRPPDLGAHRAHERAGGGPSWRQSPRRPGPAHRRTWTCRRPGGSPCPPSSSPCWRPRWTGRSAAATWLFELKLDGYRVEAIVQGTSVRLRTRNGKDAASYFPAFAATPARALDRCPGGHRGRRDGGPRSGWSAQLQPAPGAVRHAGLGVKRGERSPRQVDPEDADGSAVQPAGTLVYHAFDLLYLDGQDLLAVPWRSANGSCRLRPSGAPHGPLRESRARPRGGLPSSGRTIRAWRAPWPSCGRARYEPGTPLASLAEGQGTAGAGARRGRL